MVVLLVFVILNIVSVSNF